MEIVQFHATVSQFNAKKKLINIPQCLTELMDKYQGQKVRVRIETIDDDLK